jgi:hypothetical protein
MMDKQQSNNSEMDDDFILNPLLENAGIGPRRKITAQ